MNSDTEIILVQKGGFYEIKEINKKFIINGGNIFMENNKSYYNEDLPKANFEGNNMNIIDAIKFQNDKHNEYSKIENKL